MKLLSDSHLFQYTVITKARPQVAWNIFSDWTRWPSFANVYGSLRWHEGRPWQVGSRLFIEILRPVETVIEHVIHTWGEIAGAKFEVAGRTVPQLVNTFTETWYENFRSACDEAAEIGDLVADSA